MEETNRLKSIPEYDEVIKLLFQNIVNQSTYTNGDIVLWDFQQDQPMDQLYYNVACITSDIYSKQIYIQMPFFDYLKFKWKRKARKNIHFISRNTSKIPNEGKTSVYIIADYVREWLKIDYGMFEKINTEYYGEWK